MGIPSDPDDDGPVLGTGRFSTQTCPNCGRVERIAVCQAERRGTLQGMGTPEVGTESAVVGEGRGHAPDCAVGHLRQESW